MKQPIKLLLCLLIVAQQGFYAQIDTVFWFSAPEISTSLGDSPINLRFLTYGAPATVTVSQPANGSFVPITLNLTANSTGNIDLSSFLSVVESPAANSVENSGLKITATAKISAYYELNAPANKEIFSLKGQKALGTDFYTPFQKFWNNGNTAPKSFSSIEIVATENATTVVITPRTAVIGHAVNATFNVTLNKGQTFSVRDTVSSASSSLAGSIVSANKPIALTLYSGALSNGGCMSTMGDQITNSMYIGTDYILQRGTTTNDRVYIMAIQNATNINIYNSGTTNSLINWSETYEYPLSTNDLTYIHTNKPVYVWHAQGFGCNLSGAQLPPVYCAGTYESSFTRSDTDSLGLMLYVRNGYQGNFFLNGSASLIPSSAFSVVPGTSGEYVAATIYYSTAQVAVGSYNKVSNSGDIFGMAVIKGGAGNGSGYAYFSEFSSYPFVNAGADDTICANVTLPVNGIVGGGSVTGNWSSTGFGTFQNSTSTLSNTYLPSPLDSLITPIKLILTTTGPCTVLKDTLVLSITPSPLVNANVDQTLCVNNAQVSLNGAVTGGASTGIWSSTGSGTFSPNNTTLNATYIPSSTDKANGNVQLILQSTNSGSCLPVNDTMKVTFTSAPSVDAGADTLWVCSNNALVALSGTVSGTTTTGKWATSGNGIFTPDNVTLTTNYQSSTNDINAGSVWLYLTSTNNGNCYQEKDSLIVKYTPSPSVDAGASITTCSNNPMANLAGLVSGPTTTGVWSGGAGTYSPDSTNLSANYLPTATEVSNGSVTLTLTSTNNLSCNAVNDHVTIVFQAPPFANFNYTTVCIDKPTVFTDFSLPGFGSISSWQYIFGDGNTATTQNASNQYASAGNYTVSLMVETSLGCKDTVTKTVPTYGIPVADFSYNATCTNNNIVLFFNDLSSSASDSINFWFYDFGGQGSAAIKNPQKPFVASGDFAVSHIVQTNKGCADTIVKNINVPPMPNAGFYYNSSNGLNIGATFNFIDTSSNTSAYSWNFGDGNASSTENPSHVYFDNGDYLVTQYVTGPLGCIDSTSQVVVIKTVSKEITKLIPNAISPNGDNKNDVWKLDFIQLQYPNATVQVFNQWAQLLFDSKGYSVPWNGSYHGEFVPDGTYYYVINLNDGSKDSIYKGTLLVLKNGN
jgi:gliding motility-associated-like protein